MSFLRKLARIATHPVALMVAGVFLALSSAIELGEALLSFDGAIQGEHGAFIYGVMSTFKGLGELAEADEGVILADEGARAARKEAGED